MFLELVFLMFRCHIKCSKVVLKINNAVESRCTGWKHGGCAGLWAPYVTKKYYNVPENDSP